MPIFLYNSKNMTNLFEQLTNGECIRVDNILKSDVNEISYELLPGKIYEDSFNIFNDKEVEFEANIYTNNNRIKLRNNYVKAKRHKVAFQINTTNLKDDDYIKGHISIISDMGDLELKVVYHIVDTAENKIINSLNTVDDYYDLYLKDDALAKSLFNEKKLLKAPFLDDTMVYTAYDCLYNSSNKDIALIEFFSVFGIDIKSDQIIKNPELAKFYSQKSDDTASDNTTQIDDTESENSKNKFLADIIENIKDKELTDNLAIYCIRNNLKNEIAFNFYLKAVTNGTILNGLIEKFLVSIPSNYTKKMPLYVYKLFYEDKSYSFEQKLNLYENIINVFDEQEPIYQLYNLEIREYAISQIYQIKISESLLKIYDKILNENLVTKNNSKNILYLLRSYKVIIEDPNIKKVIIKYKEVTNETKYNVVNHIAYVPIFFDSYIMFYEDSFGNRFHSANTVIKQLINKPELEDFCLKNFPDESLFDISKVLNFLYTQKLQNEIEYFDAKLYLDKLKINASVKKRLTVYIIDYLLNKSQNSMTLKTNEIEFLKNLNLDILDYKYKNIVEKILIANNEYKFVFDTLIKYDYYLLNIKDLEIVIVYLITNNVDVNSEYLINSLLYLLYNNSKNDVVIQYLCDNFDKGIDDFVSILRASNEIGIDCFELSKKILIRMLSINRSNDLDFTYSLYDVSKDDTTAIQFAYLTKKAISYFLDDIDINDKVFNMLSTCVINSMTKIETVPLIYSLAFSKYVSKIDALNNNDIRRALLHVVDYLLANKYVFAYFKNLNKHIKMPFNIMNKEYIEYHSQDNTIPKVSFTVNDDQKEIESDMTRIYMNIYIKKIMVFKYEIINYKIYASNNLEKGILTTGTLSHDDRYELEYNYNKIQNTYNYINNAIQELNDNRLEELKKTTKDMVSKQEVLKQLFNIENAD